MSVFVQDVIDFMGGPAEVARWAVVDGDATTYPQISDALSAETQAQLRHVRYPTRRRYSQTDPDVSDLEEALKRRVQRNLALRSMALSATTNSGEFGSVRIGGGNPEIARLEGPYRRRPVA